MGTGGGGIATCNNIFMRYGSSSVVSLNRVLQPGQNIGPHSPSALYKSVKSYLCFVLGIKRKQTKNGGTFFLMAS